MPRSKKYRQIKQGAVVPNGKRIINNFNPDSIMQKHPSWAFNKADFLGKWGFSNNDFWNTILPKMRELETQSWAEITKTKKDNHSIPVYQLNKCAQNRLEELKIYEEEIFSLRFTGTIRLYGLREEGTFLILWYDANHGDNNTCVCRSYKKHT